MKGNAPNQRLIVGTDGPGDGTAVGLRTFQHDADGFHPLGELRRPGGYLVTHPTRPVVYLAGGEGHGLVVRVEVDAAGGLTECERLSSIGTYPCHLSLSPDQRYLFVANYGDGTLASFRLGPDGALVELADLAVAHGAGPRQPRQDGPHAHMVMARERSVAVVDLGTDQLRRYDVSEHGELHLAEVWVLPPGMGPRQVRRAPRPTHADDDAATANSLGVAVGELDSTVRVLSFTRFDAEVRSSRPATVQPPSGQNFPAHLMLTATGSVYVSNRGADVISHLRLVGDQLQPVADVASGGSWPRHFHLAGTRLYVANQGSDCVAVLAVDPETGTLSATDEAFAVPAPTCVLTLPA